MTICSPEAGKIVRGRIYITSYKDNNCFIIIPNIPILTNSGENHIFAESRPDITCQRNITIWRHQRVILLARVTVQGNIAEYYPLRDML